jgi:hypothetical protein
MGSYSHRGEPKNPVGCDPQTENGGPYTPPFLQCHCAALLLCVFKVEAIEVHHLDPGVYEVLHEALLPIIRPVGTPGLVMKELLRDPLYLAVPEHHALANAKTVLLRQFTGSGC